MSEGGLPPWGLGSACRWWGAIRLWTHTPKEDPVGRVTGKYSSRIAVAGAAVLGAAGGIVALGGAASAAVAVPCSAPSLIAAVTAANTTPADASLSLASGCVYSFTAADNTTDGGNALPVMTG